MCPSIQMAQNMGVYLHIIIVIILEQNKQTCIIMLIISHRIFEKDFFLQRYFHQTQRIPEKVGVLPVIRYFLIFDVKNFKSITCLVIHVSASFL